MHRLTATDYYAAVTSWASKTRRLCQACSFDKHGD